MLKTIIPVNLQ